MKVTIVLAQPQMPLVGGTSSGGGGSGYQGGVSTPGFVNITATKKTVTVQGTPDPPPAISLPTAQSGIMVPYIIGTQRIMQPNVIWYGNLRPRLATRKEVIGVEQEEIRTINAFTTEREIITTETVQETTYVAGYICDMQLGLNLGPGVKMRKLYHNDTLVWTGDIGPAPTTFETPNRNPFLTGELMFFGGNFDQLPSGYLAALIPTGVPAYVGTAFLLAKSVEVTGGFSQLSPEVERFPNPLLLDAGVNRLNEDINIATAIVDFLTSDWGGVGLEITDFNQASFVTAAIRLAEEGNFCSLYIQQETSGKSVVETLQSQARGFVYEDPATGLLNFRLVREEDVDLDDLELFDESCITSARALSKSGWDGIPNQLRATFTDRGGNYSQGIAIAQNLAVLSSAGRRRTSASVSYPACYSKSLAQKLVSRDLALLSVPRLSLELQCNRKAANKLPGDVIKLSWKEGRLTEVPFVVQKRKEHPKNSNQVTLVCDQLQLQKSNVLFTPPEDSLFNPVDTSPHTPLAVTFKDAPYWLMYKAGYRNSPAFNLLEVYPMLFVEAYSTSQVGYDIWINNIPGLGQGQVRTSAPYATIGQLVAGISQYQDIADGVITSVDISSVNNPLHLYSIGLTGVRTGRLLAFINDEIFSFESVTNLGAGVWRLNNLHRALIDTAPMAHSLGDDVFIIGNLYTWISNSKHKPASDYTPQWSLVSRSVQQVGDLDDALTSTAWTPNERPGLPNRPHNAVIQGNARSATPLGLVRGNSYDVTWASRSRKNTSTIPLQLDPAEELEIVNGIVQKHRVMIRDNASVEWSCGVTTGSGDDNELNVTIPAGASTGIGVLWVQAETSYGVSQYHDYIPITLT